LELEAVATHLVVDIEVGIEKDADFGHPNEYDLLSVGLGYARGKVVVLGETALRDRGVLDGLKRLFSKTRIIAHNGKFDLGGLYPHIGGQELWFDTMLASYCLDERPGNHGLKVLAVERLGAPQYDLEILQFIPRGGNYANIPRPILYKYNAYDVACTWELFELFQEQLEREDVRRVHDFMVAASNQLMYLELNGITIDRAYMNQLRGEFALRLDDIEEQLNQIVTDAFHINHPETVESELANAKITINPRSPKQIKEFLHDQGINVESTNQDTLERTLEYLQVRRGMLEDVPIIRFLKTLLHHRRQQKLYSTYVEGIRKRMYHGRVYTTYLLHGTTSGRLASRNPNLQNIVRDKTIRRQFAVSKPENILIQADFKQAEGRVMATMAQDEYLRRIFSDPTVDMFDELSDQLYGKGNWRKEVERIRTKAFFYGIGYGREPYSIALEYNMSPREAERRYSEFLELIPGIVAWQEDVRSRVLSGQDLITPFGRRRRFWLITEQNQKDVLNEALSFLPQSTSSDICLDAFTRVRPRLRGLGFIRLTIHDALTAECPESRKDEVASILVEEMEAAGRRYTDYVPFTTDLSFGKSWGDL
jgi:DNA polymerase-1